MTIMRFVSGPRLQACHTAKTLNYDVPTLRKPQKVGQFAILKFSRVRNGSKLSMLMPEQESNMLTRRQLVRNLGCLAIAGRFASERALAQQAQTQSPSQDPM